MYMCRVDVLKGADVVCGGVTQWWERCCAGKQVFVVKCVTLYPLLHCTRLMHVPHPHMPMPIYTHTHTHTHTHTQVAASRPLQPTAEEQLDDAVFQGAYIPRKLDEVVHYEREHERLTGQGGSSGAAALRVCVLGVHTCLVYMDTTV